MDKAAKALENLHITENEAQGKPFDPNFMNAVQQVPAPEGTESGSVVTVYQKGYRMGGKVIRPAMVSVTTGGPKRPAEEPAEGTEGE